MRNVCSPLPGALLVVFTLCFLGGCAANSDALDPWEKSNRFMYQMDDNLDRVALKPMADAYVKVVPKPIRTGVNNGFINLKYGDVILNDFLQANWNQGCSDAGRMAVNSTIGVAGLFDVASKWGMPRHENDFGITLGKWGAPAGPYLVLPLFGPSCVRDVPGLGVGIVTDPLLWIDEPLEVSIALGVLDAMDERANADIEVRFRNQAALDPYVFTRNAYLQYREGKIRGSQPPPDQGLYDEDTGSTTAPTTRPASPPTAQSTTTSPRPR